jgi:hypothetical protein
VIAGGAATNTVASLIAANARVVRRATADARRSSLSRWSQSRSFTNAVAVF